MAKFSCPVCKAATNDESGCFRHKPKKAIKRSKIKIKPKSSEKIKQEKEDSTKMNAFWIYVGENTPSFSEISNKRIEKFNKATMHHLIFKAVDSSLKFSISNILRCTIEEHSQIHLDSDYYPIVKKKIEYVQKNYEMCKNENNQWQLNYEKLKLENENNL